LEDATCAYVGLGCCYALGQGVPQNDKKANEMFQFAVEKQNKLENLLPCISEMLHCLSQIPNVCWAEEGYIAARISLKIKLKHHAKDPGGTPLLESIQYMLKHFSGTPDSIPQELCVDYNSLESILVGDFLMAQYCLVIQFVPFIHVHKNKSFYHSNSSSGFGTERKMASICSLQAFYILSI
jgi:hypothetical protein